MLRIRLKPLRTTVLAKSCKFLSSSSSTHETRMARQAAARRVSAKPIHETKHTNSFLLSSAVLIGATGLAIYEITNNPTGTLATAFYENPLYRTLFGNLDGIFEPASDKLLPDWPTAPCYSGIPPDAPCPPLLIVDVEGTLMKSVYDFKHGWRHVKRPGYDHFLKEVNKHYEVVLFTEQHLNDVGDLLDNIDPEHDCHRLDNTAGEMRGAHVLKHIDIMNRDTRRIVVIDDNPESVQYCLENTLLVRPFEDIFDEEDTVLGDLVPLLMALGENKDTDIQKTLKSLDTHQADQGIAAYQKSVAAGGFVLHNIAPKDKEKVAESST